MQPEARHIHVGNRTGSIETRENVTQLFRVIGNDPARVVVFMQPS